MSKVGDRVIAPMQFGCAPVDGVIEKIWINEYGVEMASVNYGNTDKKDWMDSWHVRVPVKSLKYDPKYETKAEKQVLQRYCKWKAQTETEMENIIEEIIKTGSLIASVSYSKPGDDCDRLWHIDTYDCEGKVFQIEYTDYMYIDLKLLGTSEIEEEIEI